MPRSPRRGRGSFVQPGEMRGSTTGYSGAPPADHRSEEDVGVARVIQFDPRFHGGDSRGSGFRGSRRSTATSTPQAAKLFDSEASLERNRELYARRRGADGA